LVARGYTTFVEWKSKIWNKILISCTEKIVTFSSDLKAFLKI